MNFKKDFPIFNQTINGYPLVYCDSAATAQKPSAVIQKISDFYHNDYSTIYRGMYSLAEHTTQQYELTREKVAQFINAQQSSEIIFVAGATAGINFVASTWGDTHIKKGDEIILTELEHHSNLIPWQQLAQKKEAQLKFIPVKSDGSIDLTNLHSIITKKTKLVAINHVSNALGTHVPVEKIIKVARAVGAKILLDSCQAVPHMRVDVQKLDCDFLVFSGHKMLAPTGVGVLFIKKEIQHEVPPYQFGGGMVLEAEYTRAQFLQPPQKYEAGTPPIAQVIGLGTAIDYLNNNVNFAELQKHEAQLCAQLIDGLQTIKGAHILGPVDELKKHGHLVTFTLEGYHPHDIAAYLDQFGICVRAGHYCAQPLAKRLGIDSSVRVSFYMYNCSEDVLVILERLRELVSS